MRLGNCATLHLSVLDTHAVRAVLRFDFVFFHSFFIGFPSRRVSDGVFEERFLGICHNTEDFVTAAKSTGLGNTRKLSKWKVFEVLNERDFVFSIQHVKLEMTRR